MDNLITRLRRSFHFYTGELNYFEFRKLISKDVTEVYDFYVKRMKKPADSKNKFIKIIKFSGNLILAFLNELTPARRIIYVFGLIFFIIGHISNDWGLGLWGFIIINVLVAFELADKLTAKDELEVAREIQLNLMPQVPPENKNYEISCYMDTAKEVGGDYYDFIKPSTEDSKTFVIIGDVSGKGMSAAIHMVQVQSMLHNIIKENSTPKEVLLTLNSNIKSILRKGAFLTLSVAELNSSREMVLSRAGHMPFLHFSKLTGQCSKIIPRGIGIGLANEQLFSNTIEEITIKPEQGDLVVMFTDGIVEAMNSNYSNFGEENLIKLLSENAHKSAKEIQEIVIRTVKQFTLSSSMQDDLTLIVMKAI